MKAEPALNLEFLTPTTKNSPLLERMPCIHYLVRFKKDQIKVNALIDSGSKVNAMTQSYVIKLGLKVQSTDVGA